MTPEEKAKYFIDIMNGKKEAIRLCYRCINDHLLYPMQDYYKKVKNILENEPKPNN